MIKLVAFDWNGTIFADTLAILESVNEVFKFLNIDQVSLKRFQQHFNVPVRTAYLAMGAKEEELDKKSAEVAKVFHTSYELRATKVRSRAHAKELLSWLSKHKIGSVIFSNHIDEPIRKQLNRLKIVKYFTEVLANTDLETAFKGRAKQNKLLDYIKDNNLSFAEVLIIGDTIEEIEIGKELGAVTVAITQGNCSTKRLRTANPDFLIHSLKGVIGIIKKLNTL